MKKRRGHCTQRAFTLIELMVVTTILMFMVIAIYYLISNSRRQGKITASKQILEQEIRLIVDHFNKDLSAASKDSVEDNLDPDNPREGASWDLELTINKGDALAPESIYYVYQPVDNGLGMLTRTSDNGTRILSKHLTECILQPTLETGAEENQAGDYKGRVAITVAGKIVPYTPHEGVVFRQGSTVVIRDFYYSAGNRWKSTTAGSGD